MEKNNRTPKQTQLIMDFYEQVACDDSLFPQNPAGQRQIKAQIMRLLGFDKPKNVTYRFGQTPDNDISVEWISLKESVSHEVNNNQSTDEADSSESSESSKVRASILPEDVQ